METNANGGILTVAQLKAILLTMPDDCQVLVASDSWYLNVSSVVTPEEGSGYLAVTLFTEDTYDPRQH